MQNPVLRKGEGNCKTQVQTANLGHPQKRNIKAESEDQTETPIGRFIPVKPRDGAEVAFLRIPRQSLKFRSS